MRGAIRPRPEPESRAAVRILVLQRMPAGMAASAGGRGRRGRHVRSAGGGARAGEVRAPAHALAAAKLVASTWPLGVDETTQPAGRCQPLKGSLRGRPAGT